MDQILLWTHPVMQIIALIIGLIAMYQGIKRFATVLGKKILFPWKQHVRMGSIALILWTAGALGFYITHSIFGDTHITGLHAELAWIIIALSLFGLVSGYIMDKYKKRRKLLPMIHGVVNVALLALVLIECWTGYELMTTFALM